jgi:hypothetical protein
MSPRSEVLWHVGRSYWALLHEDARSVTLYRWDGRTRVELHVVFDGQGRVWAWSEWRSVRQGDVDQEPGRRSRLNKRLAS